MADAVWRHASPMKDALYRLLIFWYRLTGSSQVQAEWKARQAMKKPGEARQAVETHAERAVDKRFNCVCGQLLVEGDKTCTSCGRRQWMPQWMRSAARLMGVNKPGAAAGTTLVAVMIGFAYMVQVKYGGGGFMKPNTGVQYFELGAHAAPLTLNGHWWRAYTYTLLHGGLWHIGFNLFALAQIGPMVEGRFCTARLLPA